MSLGWPTACHELSLGCLAVAWGGQDLNLKCPPLLVGLIADLSRRLDRHSTARLHLNLHNDCEKPDLNPQRHRLRW